MIIIPEKTDSFKLQKLSINDPVYKLFRDKVESSKKRTLTVTDIYRIVNSNLLERYENAERAKRTIYPNLKEEILLHGTKIDNVQSICSSGLDPRFCENTEFGEVVYLTETSAFASDFPDKDEIIPNFERCMFGCNVLIGNALDLGKVPRDLRREPAEDSFDTKQKKFDWFEYGIVAKWQTEEILPNVLIFYKV